MTVWFNKYFWCVVAEYLIRKIENLMKKKSSAIHANLNTHKIN